jgi:hypothetical protein
MGSMRFPIPNRAHDLMVVLVDEMSSSETSAPTAGYVPVTAWITPQWPRKERLLTVYRRSFVQAVGATEASNRNSIAAFGVHYLCTFSRIRTSQELSSCALSGCRASDQ